MKEKYFTEILLKWNDTLNTRQMPWKGEKDPYKVWLSEIILQQTRVEQGLSYFNKFIQAYPSIESLACAKDEKVFKMWEGLGYYSRCKNLLHTARYISKNLHGCFPAKYEEIKQLKGIGAYTAAAIASFCFNLPYAVVDGNVQRVLARIFGIEKPLDSTEGKKILRCWRKNYCLKKNAALYNQAIMDFGATVCKPALPLCTHCPMNIICEAYKQHKVSLLPIKQKLLFKKNKMV